MAGPGRLADHSLAVFGSETRFGSGLLPQTLLAGSLSFSLG